MATLSLSNFVQMDSFRYLPLGSIEQILFRATPAMKQGAILGPSARIIDELTPTLPPCPLFPLPTPFPRTFPPLPLRSLSPGLLSLPSSSQADAHQPPPET